MADKTTRKHKVFSGLTPKYRENQHRRRLLRKVRQRWRGKLPVQVTAAYQVLATAAISVLEQYVRSLDRARLCSGWAGGACCPGPPARTPNGREGSEMVMYMKANAKVGDPKAIRTGEQIVFEKKDKEISRLRNLNRELVEVLEDIGEYKGEGAPAGAPIWKEIVASLGCKARTVLTKAKES